MKKFIFGTALLSMMCAGRVFSVDVMTHDTMKEPAVIQTAPATKDPKMMEMKVDHSKDGVQKLDNFHEPTDFVAPVDSE